MNKLPLFFSYNDIIKVSKIQQIFCYFKENTSMDFQKVLSENAEKNAFISQQTYLRIWVTDMLKFDEVLFCTYCKGLLCL